MMIKKQNKLPTIRSNRRSTTDMLERVQEIGDKLLEKSLPPKKKIIDPISKKTASDSLDENKSEYFLDAKEIFL